MPERHAIIVACNEYAHTRSLQFCHADAELLTATLTEFCDYSTERLVYHLLSVHGGTSREDILADVARTVENTGDGDTVLFFFAGHGHANGDDAYLMLPNSRYEDLKGTAISTRELNSNLRRERRICVRIFDACNSGLDTRDGQSNLPDAGAFTRALESEAPEGEGWVTLASCRADERSYEDADVGHGVFTSCLTDSIRAIPDGGEVRPGSLHEDVSVRVAELSGKVGHRQTPVLNGSLLGAMGIATRSAPPPPVPSPIVLEETNLLDRLALARGSQNQLVKNRLDELGKLPEMCIPFLEAAAQKLTEFDLPLKVSEGSADLWPKSWESTFVRHFQGLGVKSLHYISSQTRNRNSYGLLAGLYDPFGSGSETTYTISSSGYPDCLARLSWEGDEFCPSGRIAVYFIPLETKLHVVIWMSVDSVISKEAGIVTFLEEFGELDKDWEPPLRAAIERASTYAVRRIRSSIEARLEYLERERNRT